MKRKVLSLLIMLTFMAGSLYAQVPSWTAPTNMQYNMQVIAKLQIADGPVYSASSSDIVGAFVSGAVRGVNSPGVDEIVYLTILSNAVSGETINLQAYIVADDVIYPVKIYENAIDAAVPQDEITSLEFASNAILGSYAEPYIFVASPATWTITPTVGTAPTTGTIDPAIATTVVEGDDLLITMEPAIGHHFTSIMVDDLSNPDPAIDVYDENLLEADGSFIYEFTNVTNDWSIEANYAINTYDLLFTAGTNGMLTGPDPTEDPVTGDFVTVDPTPVATLLFEDIPYGTDFGIVTAIADGGYEFAAWSDDEDAIAARPVFTVTEDITATATFAPTGWTPDNNYQFTMSIIGELVIDGSISTSTSDLVGAFVGGDCRGVASPDNTGIVYLSIGSDLASGEEVELRIWDSSTGATCTAASGFDFLSNAQLGTINNPYVIECQITLEKAIPVGYTWFSANIETNSNANAWNPNNYFENAWFTDATYGTPGNEPLVDDRIIGQTSFAVFATTGTGDMWVGSLTTMSPTKMYRLLITGASSRYLQLTGSAVANNPITLNAGYTWLGYLPREDLSITAALANFSGLVAGDRIISQNRFAIYNGTIWQGSLVTMSPGKGYIVQMANGGTLTYPDYVYAKSAVVTSENEVSPAGFDVPTNMKNTMTLIGQLDEASFSDKDVVYAFINGECRGMAAPSADGNIYMNIGDNGDEAQEVSFKVWVDDKGELANVDQKVTFEPLKAVGDLNNPFTFKMSEAGTTDSWMVGQAYPNPFNEQTIIPLWLKESAQVTVNVYNNMGQLVKTVAQSAAKSGVSNIILQKENLDKGVYYYTVSINSSSATMLEKGKLIIQ